jgi:muramoyltetrapeptide carboxypeptidase
VLIPAPLLPGGTIGICAPSGPVQPERLEKAISELRAEGYTVVTSPSVFSQYGLFAAPDSVRAAELEEMFSRRDVDAVFCTRGGVGASRLLDVLDTARLAASHKPFLGFSDVTALQWLLHKRHRFVSFQGPLAVEWDGSISERTRRRAFSVLAGQSNADLLGDLPRDDVQVLRGAGRMAGHLMPGNLTMICTLLGTPYLPDLTGAVLVIEDVNEPLYRVDRMLFHLRNAGILSKLSGLLAGELCASKEDTEAVKASLLDACRGTDYPIVSGLPFGHGPERVTLPVGLPVAVDAGSMTISVEQPVPVGMT